MKKALFFFVISVCLFSCETYVKIGTSESDAKIYVNGNYIAAGSCKVKINEKDCETVRIEKTGYLEEERKYCYQVKGFQKPPSSDYFTLLKDESYDASVKTDIANVDFNISVNPKLKEDEAWKIINQEVTSYFDEIVSSSKETGYLITTWKVQAFPKRTIRTRIVIKSGGTSPLVYKIKICSEISLGEGVSVKSDERFKEWDRVLRKYESVISEFKSKLN